MTFNPYPLPPIGRNARPTLSVSSWTVMVVYKSVSLHALCLWARQPESIDCDKKNLSLFCSLTACNQLIVNRLLLSHAS